MRTARHVTLLSLALVVGACGTRSDRPATLPDDLKRDLAAAATPGGDLATAPQSYQRMRFVSSVEQSRSGRPSKQVAMVHHPARAAVSRRPAPEVASATASAAEPTLADAPTSVAEAPTSVAEAPTPVPTPEAPVEQPAAAQ